MTSAKKPAIGGDLRVNARVRIPAGELQIRTSRSSGPGGQHANKTESRVEVVLDVGASAALGPNQKRRIAAKLGPVVRAISQSERSQLRNRELALERLADRLAGALRRDKPRVATKPSRAARERRLTGKHHRAEIKGARRRPSADD